MSLARKNNKIVVLDFTVLPTARPKPLDIERFVTRELKILSADMRAVQFLNAPSKLVLIECISSEAACKIASKNLHHSIQCDKEQIPIPVYINDNTVEVRVSDLPLEVADESVNNSMSQYGKVLSIMNERWKKFFPGIPNGVRALRMKLDRPIPKRLKIDGCVSTITYKGQPSRLNNNNISKPTKSNDNTNKKNSTKPSNNNKTGTSTQDNRSSNNNIPNERSSSKSTDALSSSSNNDNTSINYNKNNIEQPPSESTQNADDEESKIVRPKSQRKVLNRNNNNNNNNNNNKPNMENRSSNHNMDIEENEDSDGFQTVISKQQRKNLKRQSTDQTPEEGTSTPKRPEVVDNLLETVINKEKFYFAKWTTLQSDRSGDIDPDEVCQNFMKWQKWREMRIKMEAKECLKTVNNL